MAEVKTIRYIAYLLILITFWSCSQGYYTKNNAYRAKRDNYSLNKLPFIYSDKITTNRFYFGKIDTVVNKSNPTTDKLLISAIGLYSDGRFILTGFDYENIPIENKKKIFWETAPAVGYYRIQDNKISIEYLTPIDFGTYEKWEGEIKGDSLILYEDYSGLRNRKFIYILSDMEFK